MLWTQTVQVEKETLAYTGPGTVMRAEIHTDTLIGKETSIVRKLTDTRPIILDYKSYTPTQTFVPFHMLLQSDLIPVFHLIKSASVIFW